VEVKIPYCLQCSDYCRMTCGGPKVVIPYCHEFKRETGVGPQPLRQLGDDGKPFLVEMPSLDIEIAAKNGRKMSWAGSASVSWVGNPKLETTGKQLALCQGRSIGGNMTYECVEIKP
jgi:hypothetical protein